MASSTEPTTPAPPDEFALLADAAPVPMWVSTAEGRRLFVNDAYRALLGLEGDDALRFDWRDLLHPDDAERVRAESDAGAAAGRTFTLEARYRLRSGWRWLRSVSRPRFGPDGALAGYVGVAHDVTEARIAQEELAASEARLRFLDALAAATAVAGDADEVLAITTRLLGERLGVEACAYADVERDEDRFHTRGEWRAPSIPSRLGAHRLAEYGETVARTLRAGEPVIVDDHAADGAAVLAAAGVAATICMPFLRGGRLTGLMAVHGAAPRRWTAAEVALVRDVSERSWAHVERVRAEAALRDSERRLRLAVEGAQIGTWDYDLRTHRTNWSPRAAAIMGVPHDRPLDQRRQREMIHPDDRARIAEGTARLALAGSEFNTEYRIVRPDGAVRWISSHGQLMRDAAGVPVRAIGTVRDVTERREALEALSRLNATLEGQVADRTAERDRMWRLSRDLLLVVDRRRRVRAVNPAVEALGWRADEVVGRGLARFVHPDDRAAAAAAMRAAAQRPIGEFQARLRVKDGQWRRFSWSAAPGEGEAYVIGRDVTAETARREELEQAQDALRQAQKVEALGQLTGGVAHDFNNLLTPIIGNLDLLGRWVDDDRQARLVRGALEAAERARVLVQRLLAFARRQPLQPGPVDLAGLLGDAAALIASTVGPQVAVATEIAPDLPPALADANQLELAILNLAVNARDAMPDGGRLRLVAGMADPEAATRAGLEGDHLSLQVADTGMGMDEATAARAVEPFFSTKGTGKGTGLGLSMVHGLASQLGGAMLLRSALGEGTTVELLLPVAGEGAAAETKKAAPPAPLTGRVLLVDDEAPVRDATAAMLRSLGFAVAAAGSGEEALGQLDAADYLVTDHMMPGLKGADLARLARARRPGLKVLVVSGYAALDEIPPDLPRLPKPFRVDELAASLGALA